MQNITKQILLIGSMLLLLTDFALAAPIFTPDSQPTGWLSRPVVTLFDLSSGNETYYQLDFRKDKWSGNVLARDINALALIQDTGPWDPDTAASILDSTNYNTGRKIATLGRAFRWASLTAAQKTDLVSEENTNFIRGDRSNEEPDGISLHQRGSVLGDILHSNIYFWDDGTNQTLYVGSNDGMLHAFDANTGVENFAYIPSMVIPKLHLLTNKTYVHTYFVDGPISIANMEFSGTLKTVLVGALGAGGAGLFALDVTTPTATDEADVASKVMWEITATGSFGNLGYTYGAPALAKLDNDTNVVIIGNGYVNKGNGHAVLYVINALTGAFINAIDTGSGSAASPNGLSSPALYDTDRDGRPELAYAGDIDGNLWKFDLVNNTSSLVMTTSPAQAITTAPVVQPHALGGQMIAFATGRILTSGDKVDTSTHYVYGVWDGAPDANTNLVTQVLSPDTVGSDRIRIVTDNPVDWENDKGWKVALPVAGERVVGERPFYNNGRFYILSTNPTIDGGENWINELLFSTAGEPSEPIFDLDRDGVLLGDTGDMTSGGNKPVSKYLGSGIFSQPRLVVSTDVATTLYAAHPDLPISDGVPSDPDDPGVSGGHFDFDIFYYAAEVTSTVATPNYDDVEVVNNYCKKTSDVSKNLDGNFKGCEENAAAGYTYLTDYTTGAICKPNDDAKKVEYYQTLFCSTVTLTEVTEAPYKKVKHVHEYDDKYDVTGVNMLNASLADFNLDNAITDPTTPFKILVMNQFLNPAAKLAVGGAEYESVKTYENLASQTNPETLLAGLPVYTQLDIEDFIFNLPLDAFKSKDWWGDGGRVRAGLIPTQTGCVNGVNIHGVQDTPGQNGERFNGALAFQLIRPDTPAEALELNGPDVTYGWRVKLEFFKDYVLAEYTTFWHHPNKLCYDDEDRNEWIPDPAEDFEASTKTADKAPGSADPTDGIFGQPIISTTVLTGIDGSVTTTTTYSDGTDYIKIVTDNEDGSQTIYQRFRDGTEETVTLYDSDGGEAKFVDPNSDPGSPLEALPYSLEGRQSWRDMID